MSKNCHHDFFQNIDFELIRDCEIAQDCINDDTCNEYIWDIYDIGRQVGADYNDTLNAITEPYKDTIESIMDNCEGTGICIGNSDDYNGIDYDYDEYCMSLLNKSVCDGNDNCKWIRFGDRLAQCNNMTPRAEAILWSNCGEYHYDEDGEYYETAGDEGEDCTISDCCETPDLNVDDGTPDLNVDGETPDLNVDGETTSGCIGDTCPCEDIPGWFDDYNLTCADYERLKWCEKGELTRRAIGGYLPQQGGGVVDIVIDAIRPPRNHPQQGDNYPPPAISASSADGAKQNCCVCGGGIGGRASWTPRRQVYESIPDTEWMVDLLVISGYYGKQEAIQKVNKWPSVIIWIPRLIIAICVCIFLFQAYYYKDLLFQKFQRFQISMGSGNNQETDNPLYTT